MPLYATQAVETLPTIGVNVVRELYSIIQGVWTILVPDVGGASFPRTIPVETAPAVEQFCLSSLSKLERIATCLRHPVNPVWLPKARTFQGAAYTREEVIEFVERFQGFLKGLFRQSLVVQQKIVGLEQELAMAVEYAPYNEFWRFFGALQVNECHLPPNNYTAQLGHCLAWMMRQVPPPLIAMAAGATAVFLGFLVVRSEGLLTDFRTSGEGNSKYL